MRKNIQQYKKKYSSIPPEEIEKTKWYSFSFNPMDQPERSNIGNIKLNTLSSWTHVIKDRFERLKHCHYKLYLESSSQGRLHYHGYIQITHPIEFAIDTTCTLRMMGTFEIDNIDDMEVWDKYVTKQEIIMRKYCLKKDMVYEITNVQ